MSRLSRTWLLFLLPLTLAACGGKDDPAPATGGAAPQSVFDGEPPTDAPDEQYDAPRENRQRRRSPLEVNITSINYIDSLDRPGYVGVHPGDVVHLTVDAFRDDSPLGFGSEEFSWQAGNGRICHGSLEDACYNSGFLIDDDGGVFFIVPDFMPARITLKVWLSRNDSKYDTLVLENYGLRGEYYFDFRFRIFPRWNHAWDGERRGRWHSHWDRRYWDRDRNNHHAPRGWYRGGGNWNRGGNGHHGGNNGPGRGGNDNHGGNNNGGNNGPGRGGNDNHGGNNNGGNNGPGRGGNDNHGGNNNGGNNGPGRGGNDNHGGNNNGGNTGPGRGGNDNHDGNNNNGGRGGNDNHDNNRGGNGNNDNHDNNRGGNGNNDSDRGGGRGGHGGNR
ncbi:MAG TPA: hypothetical protein VIH99_07955 [Bdellovibrionota bacterium]|jgi:hypothetical protein